MLRRSQTLTCVPSPSPSPDGVEELVSLLGNPSDVFLKLSHLLEGFLDRRRLVPLGLPTFDLLLAVLELAVLLLELLAQGASLGLFLALAEKLHAACFAHAVLGLTVLAELSPLPITTLEDVIVVEAHCFRLLDVGSHVSAMVHHNWSHGVLPDPDRDLSHYTLVLLDWNDWSRANVNDKRSSVCERTDIPCLRLMVAL